MDGAVCSYYSEARVSCPIQGELVVSFSSILLLMWERNLYVYDIVDGACSAFFVYCWTQDQISLLLELCFVPFDQLYSCTHQCFSGFAKPGFSGDIRVKLFQKWTESS
jgi:hypothetical protein